MKRLKKTIVRDRSRYTFTLTDETVAGLHCWLKNNGLRKDFLSTIVDAMLEVQLAQLRMLSEKKRQGAVVTLADLVTFTGHALKATEALSDD